MQKQFSRFFWEFPANVAAGQLSNVARDWSSLDPGFHAQGLEVVLQTHLFAGFPRTINALATINQVGINASDRSWASEDKDYDSWKKNGAQTCETVYGGTQTLCFNSSAVCFL